MSEKRDLRVSLPVAQWEAFCAAASEERLSPSSLMKRLIRDHLGLARDGNPLPATREDEE